MSPFFEVESVHVLLLLQAASGAALSEAQRGYNETDHTASEGTHC